MSKYKDSIYVGVANDGRKLMIRSEVEEWKPKKVTYLGTTTFFQIDEIFYSMERVKFDEIFKK